MSTIETNVSKAILEKYENDLNLLKNGRNSIKRSIEHSKECHNDPEIYNYLNKKLNRLSNTINRLEQYIEEFKETHAEIL